MQLLDTNQRVAEWIHAILKLSTKKQWKSWHKDLLEGLRPDSQCRDRLLSPDQPITQLRSPSRAALFRSRSRPTQDASMMRGDPTRKMPACCFEVKELAV